MEVYVLERSFYRGVKSSNLSANVKTMKYLAWKGLNALSFSLVLTCAQSTILKLFIFIQVFAAPYSLRFPRIDRVRYDKPWHECLDVQCKEKIIQKTHAYTYTRTDTQTHTHTYKYVCARVCVSVSTIPVMRVRIIGGETSEFLIMVGSLGFGARSLPISLSH